MKTVNFLFLIFIAFSAQSLFAVCKGFNISYHNHPNGGGFVESTAFVADSAFVGPNAYICGNAKILDNAKIYGSVHVMNNTVVSGDAKIHGKISVLGGEICGTAHLYGNYFTPTDEEEKLVISKGRIGSFQKLASFMFHRMKDHSCST
ncbi:MAG: hypothetical protein KBD63_03075 [Bacteriovoracaceae bacterium]|nr:hypothetical protein [Bacteriovoracaceae bacterium]